jgi:chromosome segregation ATPase
MENELKNMTKQELVQQLVMLKKSSQKLESSIAKKDQDIARKDQDIAKKEDDVAQLKITIANLQRMLYGTKKERFISENKEQLALLFEEFASEEALADETPVKEKSATSAKSHPSTQVEINYLKTFQLLKKSSSQRMLLRIW